MNLEQENKEKQFLVQNTWPLPNDGRSSWRRYCLIVFLLISILAEARTSVAFAHGFNANHVDIVKTFGGKYRVIIKYTHVELGEYRETHIDFEKKEDAIKAFQDLVKGADFFLGDSKKSIHFHTPPETNSPY